ncbi:MAG: acyl--CoA ligase, partial [Acidobacteria bacterium]|nr:acyl--CoA ligase [Acidobacteriota bacterium]
DRVGLLCSNRLEHVETVFAIMSLGAVWVPLNDRLTAVELGFIVDDAECTTMMYSDNLAGVAEEMHDALGGVEKGFAITYVPCGRGSDGTGGGGAEAVDRLPILAEDIEGMRHRVGAECARDVDSPAQAGNDVAALEVTSLAIDDEQPHRVRPDVDRGADHRPGSAGSTHSGLRTTTPSTSAAHMTVQLRGSTRDATQVPIGLSFPAA